MKKYCILVLIADICCLCMLVLLKSAYRPQKVDSSEVQIETGSSQDEVYINEEDVKPKIAITFDDGPNPQWTPKLLEGLKERGVQASFFVMGEKAEKYPQIIKKMYEEGHLIGNHTYSHVQLTTLSQEEACLEITKTCQVIYDITGEYPVYIRPPYGSWDEQLECGINLLPVRWNIDTLDWTTSNTANIVSKAVNGAKENGIILLHDNYESSVEAALEIIDRLQEQGYEFVTVDEILLD